MWVKAKLNGMKAKLAGVKADLTRVKTELKIRHRSARVTGAREGADVRKKVQLVVATWR